ncbi:hypothetical protein [Streptomyces sp. NPDC056683]|uniref:hypothetical protein n=1 Tax=Streptomyces sp. NPDC056683 TaxID=3345910 RepID=UPI0036A73B26
MGTQGSSAAWRGRVLAPVLIYLSSVVAVISSLGAPLIPTIAAADHVSLSEAQWSLTITLLVGAVATAQPGLHHALVLLADRIPVTAALGLGRPGWQAGRRPGRPLLTAPARGRTC